MPAKVFDVRNDSVSVDGRMITAWAEGDPVTWTHTQPNSVTKTPIIGSSYRVKQNSPVGNVVLRVLPDTADYKFLLNLANSQKEFKVVVNAQGERISGTQGAFNQLPNGSISNNTLVRELTAELLDYKIEATN